MTSLEGPKQTPEGKDGLANPEDEQVTSVQGGLTLCGTVRGESPAVSASRLSDEFGDKGYDGLLRTTVDYPAPSTGLSDKDWAGFVERSASPAYDTDY